MYYKKEYPIINDDAGASTIGIDEESKKIESPKEKPVEIIN